jgi:hypothetical protein
MPQGVDRCPPETALELLRGRGRARPLKWLPWEIGCRRAELEEGWREELQRVLAEAVENALG